MVGMPQRPGIVKVRLALARIAGPPYGPLAFRVSAIRHGVMLVKARGGVGTAVTASGESPESADSVAGLSGSPAGEGIQYGGAVQVRTFSTG